MLANLCSKECEQELPKPPKDYVEFPHKGGADLKQPDMDEFEYMRANYRTVTLEEIESGKKETKNEKPKLLQLIRKIWKK